MARKRSKEPFQNRGKRPKGRLGIKKAPGHTTARGHTGDTARGFYSKTGFFRRLIIAILAAILFPVFAKAREKARQTQCLNNVRQIATAATMYAQDHDEILPDAANFWGAISLDKGVLVCPTAARLKNGYVFPANLGGKALGEIKIDPTSVAVVADGQHTVTAPDQQANLAYTQADVAQRHLNNTGKSIQAFIDGHAAITDAPIALKYAMDIRVLFVVGDNNALTTGTDTPYITRLTNMGATVTVADDAATTVAGQTASAAVIQSNFDLVVISDSVASNQVFLQYLGALTIPVINMDGATGQNGGNYQFGAVYALSTGTNTTARPTVDVVTPRHAIAGAADVSGSFAIGTAGTNASPNASSGNTTTGDRVITSTTTPYVGILAYDTGAKLYGTGNAPARRVHFSYNNGSDLTNSGWLLWDASCRWSVGGY